MAKSKAMIITAEISRFGEKKCDSISYDEIPKEEIRSHITVMEIYGPS